MAVNEEEQVEELHEIFRLFDNDNSGSISQDEMCSLMRSMGLRTSKDDIQFLMKEIGLSGSTNDEITWDMFLSAATKRVKSDVSSEELKHAFGVLNSYDQVPLRDGLVRSSTITSVLLNGSKKMGMHEAKEIIDVIAPTTDFDYKQFVNDYFQTE